MEHDGTANNIEEAKKHGSNPDVLAGNVVVHNVEEANRKTFEDHVKEFDKLGKRAHMKPKGKPFRF